MLISVFLEVRFFSVAPRSRPSVTVNIKYLGHIFQNRVIVGAFVFHKHILFLFKPFTIISLLLTFFRNKAFKIMEGKGVNATLFPEHCFSF